MTWGILRVVIFTTAFLFGVLANESVNANLPPTDQDAMKSVVGCGERKLIIRPDTEAIPEKIPVPVHQLGPIAAIQHQ